MRQSRTRDTNHGHGLNEKWRKIGWKNICKLWLGERSPEQLKGCSLFGLLTYLVIESENKLKVVNSMPSFAFIIPSAEWEKIDIVI